MVIAVSQVNRLDCNDALLVVVDVQGKLARMMADSESVIRQVQILIQGCRILELPIVWAEQLPDKLGATLPQVAECLSGLQPIAKSSFGCCGDADIYSAIRASGRKQVILCGIEAHVCVWQTAAVLLNDGYQVYLAADAVSSRAALNREIAFRRMVASGVHLTCVEMSLFELMLDAKHPKFRDVTRLLK
jgi:nicotinamidase-related amidase